ncbi:hypothetical protein [Bacillus sp. B-jedd]|uniref:hypothetical protein n=1 Tax=Bacillus sp. B-jedd TaxID=1476857 RepID=UPI0005155C5F|nr:hypothetical protein [Bacillus sp. B-jedd]CEG25637.1 hypothetical protein BN1002_00452 [Bacillus sp. B-jedd]
MDKFSKYILLSIFTGALGLVITLNIEEWMRWDGQVNKVLLVLGAAVSLLFILSSLYSLRRAYLSGRKNKVRAIVSTAAALLPICTLILNAAVIWVWFFKDI